MVRIKKAEDALRYQSVTDGLTGLYNRRFTFARLDEELSRAKRHNLSIACVVIDLDHFKKVNDEYGHLAGDTALRNVSEMLLRHARKEDLPCRYGGEEFLLVLPQTHTAGAVTLTERIRESLEKEAIRTDEGLVHITLSAGIAAFPENGAATPDDLLRLADAALYEAKEKGRNRVVTYSAEKSN
jgi:diguanylate cyclase (GGDEF)-like protein